MAISFAKVSLRVFAIVKGAGRKVKMFDEVGNKIFDPEKCRRFFISPENIMVTIREYGDDSEIKIYLPEGINIESIQRLLNSLRKTAVHYNLKFTVRKFGRKISPKDFAYQAEIEKQRMAESTVMEKMGGYKKTSYEKFGNCRMVVRHTNAVDDNIIGARGRNIGTVYVENANGERFMLAAPLVSGGRALARHLSEGGSIDDEISSSIKTLIAEWKDIKEVSNYMSSNMRVIGDNDDTREIRSMAEDRLIDINKKFKSMTGKRGYKLNSVSISEDVNSSVGDLQNNIEKFKDILCIVDDTCKMGLAALAKYKSLCDCTNNEIIEEPDMSDEYGIEEFENFNEWINQFEPEKVLKEHKEDNDMVSAGTVVSVIPTPAINSSAFPVANWIKEPTTVTINHSATIGSLEIISCVTKDGEEERIYGFNIVSPAKQTDDVAVTDKPDSVWEAAARMVKWKTQPDIICEMADNMSDQELEIVLERISSIWMPHVANEIKDLILSKRNLLGNLQETWKEISKPVITEIQFMSSVDMILSTKRLTEHNIKFDSDFEKLALCFENSETCLSAAKYLKEQNITFKEDIFGGDMGDDFIRDISVKSAQLPDNNTPKYTEHGYTVDECDVKTLYGKLKDCGIDFSIEKNTFYFDNDDDKKQAEKLHHPNNADRGIIDEMKNLRSTIINLSDYKK